MAAFSIGLGGLVATVAMGYTSPALPSMRADPDIHISPEQVSITIALDNNSKTNASNASNACRLIYKCVN